MENKKTVPWIDAWLRYSAISNPKCCFAMDLKTIFNDPNHNYLSQNRCVCCILSYSLMIWYIIVIMWLYRLCNHVTLNRVQNCIRTVVVWSTLRLCISSNLLRWMLATWLHVLIFLKNWTNETFNLSENNVKLHHWFSALVYGKVQRTNCQVYNRQKHCNKNLASQASSVWILLNKDIFAFISEWRLVTDMETAQIVIIHITIPWNDRNCYSYIFTLQPSSYKHHYLFYLSYSHVNQMIGYSTNTNHCYCSQIQVILPMMKHKSLLKIGLWSIYNSSCSTWAGCYRYVWYYSHNYRYTFNCNYDYGCQFCLIIVVFST